MHAGRVLKNAGVIKDDGTFTFLEKHLPAALFAPPLLGAFLKMINAPLFILRRATAYIENYFIIDGKRHNSRAHDNSPGQK